LAGIFGGAAGGFFCPAGGPPRFIFLRIAPGGIGRRRGRLKNALAGLQHPGGPPPAGSALCRLPLRKAGPRVRVGGWEGGVCSRIATSTIVHPFARRQSVTQRPIWYIRSLS